MDPSQAPDLARDQTCFIHQLGNNWDHTFVLRAALANPGIVVLHDLRLLYLYESLGLSGDEMLRTMARSNSFASPSRAAPFALDDRKRRFDHLLFDMLADVVDTAKAVVVHTAYAKNVIQRHYGPAVSRKTHIIPHFAIASSAESRETARARLSLEDDWFVIATTGFATRTKRFDLLVEALDKLTLSHRRVIWVQAGAVRPHEYDLERLVDQYPRVRAITRFTGYLSERDLDGYVRAADVLVNLRFPSVGESSGSLARALAAGTCCIVSDTAGYRELPDNVVIKIPPHRGSEPLSKALLRLFEEPSLKERYGRNAHDFAVNELSLSGYTSSLRHLIERISTPEPFKDAGTAALPEMQVFSASYTYEPGRYPDIPRLPAGAPVSLRLGPIRVDAMKFAVMRQFMPERMHVISVELEEDQGGDGQTANEVFLRISGYHLGR